MQAAGVTELMLIRHAPALDGGRLAGRRDVPADLRDAGALAGLRAAVGAAAVVASPARRCRETAAALWPDLSPRLDPRLWEQDFGAWEGVAFADLPDLGDLSSRALAAHRPPGGESFADLCARATPALLALAGSPGPVAVVAHAGIVRAALALATGQRATALGFEIAPFSATLLRARPGGVWSVGYVNRVAK